MKNNNITNWFKERIPNPLKEYFQNFTIPQHKHSFWYYLGGFTLMCIVVQVVTGILLLFYYKPNAEDAYNSIEYIMLVVPFGGTVRSLHFWSANGLMIGLIIHMFSSFFMKAYRKPREFVWFTGVILLFLTFLFAFTGHVLPWDELAYSSAQVGLAEIERFPLFGKFISSLLKGGREVSGESLSRIFSLHTSVLPILTLLILIIHLALTKLYGFSKPVGDKETKESLKYYFAFKYRNTIIWLLGLAVLITLAVLIPHYSGKAFDLNNIAEAPSGIHPEWYFMFFYQLLRLDTILPGGYILLGLFFLFLFWLIIPLADRKANEEKKSKIFPIAGIVILIIIIILTVWGYWEI
ncbi:MAG: cytochrome bc complex cytochrome b subunit [Ignavibacteriae bacterium]|nr:MAG: cytochrome bc complex cytochrome b subunit [Ignavibacteriota bacterium]